MNERYACIRQCPLSRKSTKFGLISVGYPVRYVLLRLLINIVVFHQLSHVIFFGAHTNYLFDLGENLYSQ